MRTALLSLVFAVAAAAAPLQVGPWTLDAAADGPRLLCFGGRPLVESTSCAGYLPEWKGVRFSLREATPSRSADGLSFTWTREQPGAATLALTLRLEGDTATWSLEAEVQAAGPCEFGLYLSPDLLTAAAGGVLVSTGKELSEIGPPPHPQLTVGQRLLIERPDATLEWTCTSAPGAFALQDWRLRQPPALRLITVMDVVAPPTRIAATAILRVAAHDPAAAALRSKTLFQKTRWSAAVAVANAGFEDGMTSDWTAGPTGSVVQDVVHTGKRAARLQVSDPQTESVYITRQIPVVGGALYEAGCWVRTQGVEARSGKMPSVGAGLIVEWADRDGNWFAGGQYACDLYGDHEWTLRTCGDLRAPEEAGFAVLFLTLRGVGTAWFDDLDLVQVHQRVALEAPSPGTTLADNTPTLRWRGAVQAASLTVELSRELTFPTASTRTVTAAESPHTVMQALEPGTWYWRVNAPGYDSSVVWDFVQTAPADQDTTAPVLLHADARVASAAGVVQIEVEEDTPTPPRLEARQGTQALTAERQASREGRHRFHVRPAPAWQPGLNEIAVVATDSAGNRTEGIFRVVFQPIPENPVRISATGAYECAGEPIFPLGIYQVSPAAMPTVKAAGFEIVHSYEWESSQDEVAARQYLDAAWRNGLRVFIGFDRGIQSGKGLVQGNDDAIRRRVAALCDHPGLFCWYLFDEPEVPGQYVSPRALTRFADLIRALDPYHPVVVTTWGNRMNSYRASWDTHWTQSYSTPAEIVRTIGAQRRLLENASPMTLLAHCYDQKQTAQFAAGGTVDPAAFAPDPAWLRAAAFAGITQQVNGLFWWWYADGNKQYYTVAHVPAAWAALSSVVGQIRTLRPVLTAPGTTALSRLTVDGGTIETWSKTVAGERIVIAVHTGENEVTATLPAAGAGPATVLFEERLVSLQAGVLRDTFARYAVHVYRFRE
jgi:hypothetical protein